MKIVMLTSLEDERSPWDVPSHECRTWAYVLGADTRNAQRVASNPQLVAEWAAARVPYVGADVTHCAQVLGVLTCDPFDVATALTYCEELFDPSAPGSRTRYRPVTARQYDRLGSLDEDSSRARFWRALDNALA